MRFFYLFIGLMIFSCNSKSSKDLFFAHQLNLEFSKFKDSVEVFHYDAYGFTDKCERSFFVFNGLYGEDKRFRKINSQDIKNLSEDFIVTKTEIILNNFSKAEVKDILLEEIDCKKEKKYHLKDLFITKKSNYFIIRNGRSKETLFFIKICDPVD